MTQYIVTGRPVGPPVEELDYHGVGTTLDLDLTAEREAELIDRRVLRKADDTTAQEASDDGSAGSTEPEPVAADEPAAVEPEPVESDDADSEPADA